MLGRRDLRRDAHAPHLRVRLGLLGVQDALTLALLPGRGLIEAQSAACERSRVRPPLQTNAILDGAFAVFEQRGYAQACVKEIAQEEGVAKPTVYNQPRTSGGARPAQRCSRPSHATTTLTCSPPSSSSAVSWNSPLPVTDASGARYPRTLRGQRRRPPPMRRSSASAVSGPNS
ncbi:TetR family transcriptional regulator [Streptomyces sp. NPDC008121]|uniref:helix-turn-helix domain-containing protein n=1 Tax=Streptomyces sp. NPDC008121 TaxID=3364809 RepID=UPI0036EFD098